MFKFQSGTHGFQITQPVQTLTVGDNVWIGINVSVLLGISIGSNTIIRSGSIVNKDIPTGLIAAGVPCKVIPKITGDNRKKLPRVYRNVMKFQFIEMKNLN